MSRAEKVCWTIVAICTVFVVGPFLFEDLFEHLGDAQYALMMTGLMVGLTSAISSGLFKARGRAKARLHRGQGLLAHWTYAPDEWQSFTEEDAERSNKGKWMLFAIVAFWAVIFGVAFPIFDPENGWVVTIVMAGLLALIAVVIVVGTWIRRGRRRHAKGEARIALDSLWLDGGELHVWKGWGAKLEDVGVVEGTPPCLAVVYSTITRTGKEMHTVNVPIPRGRDAEAAEVAEKLLASIAKRK